MSETSSSIWQLLGWSALAVLGGAVVSIPTHMVAELAAFGRISGDWTGQYAAALWMGYIVIAMVPFALPGVFNLAMTVLFFGASRGAQGSVRARTIVLSAGALAALVSVAALLWGPERGTGDSHLIWVALLTNAVAWMVVVTIWARRQSGRVRPRAVTVTD